MNRLPSWLRVFRCGAFAAVQSLRLIRQLAVAVLVLVSAAGPASAIEVRQVLVPENSHPAAFAAAKILAREFALPESAITTVRSNAQPQRGQLILTTNAPTPAHRSALRLSRTELPAEGYGIVFSDGAAWLYGQRPRALLYAAGDADHWKQRKIGLFRHEPAFTFRSASLHGRLELPDFVARLGVNVIIGRRDSPVSLRETLPEVYKNLKLLEGFSVDRAASRNAEAHKRLAAECHALDVDYYPMLYGNDFRRWSPELYAAAIKTFPTAEGKDAPASWERGSLCPSDPQTWKVIQAYVREFIQQSGADGLYATFWDNYGLFCQCDRCVKNRLNLFPNELKACVSNYQTVTAALGRKLVVRTWSSGVPHWLGDQWVHAPGNGGPSGDGVQLWGRVITELPEDIILQTKVYQADCQPDPPFSELLGKGALHREIAEYQITGQTTGRFYFPASTVDHTAWTMRRSLELVGARGGVSLFPGGTRNGRYDLFADIANSINVYAWRELTWNPETDVTKIWQEWATAIYGEQAAPFIVRALRRSESVVNRLFSALGLGNDTNSGFPRNVQRRETLLKYTNRYFTKAGQEVLAPTAENVARVVAEKDDCLRQIEAMEKDLARATPYLKPEQAAELRTRFEWLHEFAYVARNLDESLWRYRYLRQQALHLTTDASQMPPLAASYDAVREHYGRMFRFDPAQRFACYDVPLGRLPTKPSLGSPLPLMEELYQGSRAYVEEFVGANALPASCLRGRRDAGSIEAIAEPQEPE